MNIFQNWNFTKVVSIDPGPPPPQPSQTCWQSLLIKTSSEEGPFSQRKNVRPIFHVNRASSSMPIHELTMPLDHESTCLLVIPSIPLHRERIVLCKYFSILAVYQKRKLLAIPAVFLPRLYETSTV